VFGDGPCDAPRGRANSLAAAARAGRRRGAVCPSSVRPPSVCPSSFCRFVNDVINSATPMPTMANSMTTFTMVTMPGVARPAGRTSGGTARRCWDWACSRCRCTAISAVMGRFSRLQRASTNQRGCPGALTDRRAPFPARGGGRPHPGPDIFPATGPLKHRSITRERVLPRRRGRGAPHGVLLATTGTHGAFLATTGS
jgi:hypothetical protein